MNKEIAITHIQDLVDLVRKEVEDPVGHPNRDHTMGILDNAEKGLQYILYNCHEEKPGNQETKTGL